MVACLVARDPSIARLLAGSAPATASRFRVLVDRRRVQHTISIIRRSARARSLGAFVVLTR